MVDIGSITAESCLQRLRATPALSVGIIIFSLIFYALYPTDSTALVLLPSSPIDLNLNAISFYIFPHVNLFHLILNLVALFPLLSRYEASHGTVYTGVTLNLLAVVTALQYCLVGLLLYPTDAVGGLSGICFSLLTYFCYKEHESNPVIMSLHVAGSQIQVPTLYFPFFNLFLIALVIPSTSFFGHLAAIGAGYLLALGKLSVLYPPTKILLAIETFLAGGIAKLQGLVLYIREEDAINMRSVAYAPILSEDLELNNSGAGTETEGFSRRLGT